MLLLIASQVNTNANNPYVSIKNGITNFFSNTKNLIWTGLAILVAGTIGMGLLYRQYKKEMKEDENATEKNLPISVSQEDISSLILEIGVDPKSVKSCPTKLIKKYLPEINIEIKENIKNSKHFQDILFQIYYICGMTNSMYKNHNTENNANKSNSKDISEIKKTEDDMTKKIKLANKEKHKDDNLNNLIQFLGQTYCYIAVNNEDIYPYTYGSKTFNTDNIKTASNKNILIPESNQLDEKCFFSILETIKQKNQPEGIKEILEGKY